MADQKHKQQRLGNGGFICVEDGEKWPCPKIMSYADALTRRIDGDNMRSLLIGLTKRAVETQYDNCFFCGRTIRIENVVQGTTLLMVNPVYKLYENHADDCPWIKARQYLGDENA